MGLLQSLAARIAQFAGTPLWLSRTAGTIKQEKRLQKRTLKKGASWEQVGHWQEHGQHACARKQKTGGVI